MLGSSLGTPTSLEVGTNPAIYDQYGQLQGTIAKMEEELARLMQGVRRLQQLQAAAGALPPERQELYRRLLQAQEQRQRELVAKKEQLALLEKAMESIKDAYVQVSDAIFPVFVSISASLFTLCGIASRVALSVWLVGMWFAGQIRRRAA